MCALKLIIFLFFYVDEKHFYVKVFLLNRFFFRIIILLDVRFILLPSRYLRNIYRKNVFLKLIIFFYFFMSIKSKIQAFIKN